MLAGYPMPRGKVLATQEGGRVALGERFHPRESHVLTPFYHPFLSYVDPTTPTPTHSRFPTTHTAKPLTPPNRSIPRTHDPLRVPAIVTVT